MNKMLKNVFWCIYIVKITTKWLTLSQYWTVRYVHNRGNSNAQIKLELSWQLICLQSMLCKIYMVQLIPEKHLLQMVTWAAFLTKLEKISFVWLTAAIFKTLIPIKIQPFMQARISEKMSRRTSHLKLNR
jgi:hypothetical protein